MKASGSGRVPAERERQRILVICPFPEGMAPAQRLKYEQYFDDWHDNGFEVVVSSYFDMSVYGVLWKHGFLAVKIMGALKGLARRCRDILRVRNADIVYVFMWVTPLGPAWPERLFRFLAKRIVYDIDDNVHIGQKLSGPDNPNAFIRFLKNRNKPIHLMRSADAVITSSPFLESEAKRLNESNAATYITSSVDTEYFVPRTHRPANPKIVVGWTGTFSSKPFLDMLAPALRRLTTLRDFEFRIVGNFDYAMNGVDVKVVEFNRASEIADLERFDIGIYPLPDDDWVLGKSGLKAIVYMAMGIPVVASPVGTTPLLFAHGEFGFMAKDEDEWVRALIALIDDEAMRMRMGNVARQVAVEHYSRYAVKARYLNVLRGVMGPK